MNAVASFGGISLASGVFTSEGISVEQELALIKDRFPKALNSSTTFYLDQQTGNDQDSGEISSPWADLEYAIAKIKETYKSNAVTTLRLLDNYILPSALLIDLGDFLGAGAFVIDLNGFNLNLTNGNLNLQDGEGLSSFAIENGIIGSSTANRRLNINNFRSPCDLFIVNLQVAVAFNSCYKPSVRGTEAFFIFPETPVDVSGGSISFNNCENPVASVIDLRNNHSISFAGSPNAIVENVRIHENNNNSGGSYISYVNCNFFNQLGTISLNTSRLRRRILNVQNSRGNINLEFVNEFGSNINLELTNDDHLLEIGDSAIDYRDTTSLSPFLTGSGGRGLRIDARSQVDWNTSFRSPEELPIINVLNDIETGATLNEKDYISTIGLFSQSQPDAINELGKVVFLGESDRVVSGFSSSWDGASATNWTIDPGKAYFFDDQDRENPQLRTVSIAQSASIDIAGIIGSTSGVRYSYIDDIGNIGYQENYPRSQDLDGKIFLNKITYVNGQITEFAPLVLAGDPETKALLDQGSSQNVDVQITPAIFNPSAVNFQLQVNGGRVLLLGENYLSDPNNPHAAIISSVSGNDFLIWDEYDPTGALIEQDASVLNFGRHFENGALQTFANNNDATVKYFYVNSSGEFISIVGTERYGNLNVAVQRSAIFDIPPNVDNYALVATLIGAGNGTDSSNLASLRIVNKGSVTGDRLTI